MGLKPNCCVSIIGFNAPQWYISAYGAIFAGGVCCGLYTTNTAETCMYALKDTQCEIVVVENTEQLDKILKYHAECKIKSIIQYSGAIKDSLNGLVITV